MITDGTGSPYREVAAAVVLAPLGMDSSSFPPAWPGDDPYAVAGYRLTADGTFARARREVSTMPAAAGLWSTAADLVRFATGWPLSLPDQPAREALTPQAPDSTAQWAQTGLGWMLDPDVGIAGEDGVGRGTAASVVMDVDSGRACVVLTNRLVPIQSLPVRALAALED